jgi:hypothetical protein
MEKQIKELLDNWQRRNIEGIYCSQKDDIHQKLLELIPQTASIGFCGSQTLEELEIIEMLESRGNKIFNQYQQNLSREESLEMRNLGAGADYFLSSANAISKQGELVFFSAYGHRIAGLANAKNVIIISGTNKITPDLAAAITRAREYVAPLNCKRLKWEAPCFKEGKCRQETCLLPEYHRMCCQILIIEAEINSGRLKVILVDEELGF